MGSPNQHIGLVKCANHWLVTRFDEDSMTCVSNPELDLEVAKCAAKIFAKIHKIPYQKKLIEYPHAFMTVIKIHLEWYPARIEMNEIYTLKSYPDKNSEDNTLEKAIEIASRIARRDRIECFPLVGLNLNPNNGNSEAASSK